MIRRRIANKSIERLASVFAGVALVLLAACGRPLTDEQAADPAQSRPSPPAVPQDQSMPSAIFGAVPVPPPAEREEIVVSGSRMDRSDGLRRLQTSATPMTIPADAAAAGALPPGVRPGGSTLLSQVQPGEELWVIQTASTDASNDEDTQPGSGTMLALLAREPAAPATEVPLPLRHTDVHAVVTGYISAVDVTQQFE
ncbi:MAG TPA: hypothetical protein VNA66_03905, partial [Gammaproteobacteria bacterium]|nr:hypothetical protein [Gammaproteobacteria bacterium]